MSDDFALWFPAGWAMFGALSSFFDLLFAVVLWFFGPKLFTTDQGEMTMDLLEEMCDHLDLFRPGSDPETTPARVEELRMAVTPLGESIAETLRGELRQLRDEVRASMNDMQPLAAVSQEIRDTLVRGLMTDSQAPAPELLEIITLLNGLRTDLQLLATATHEVHDALTVGLKTDSQESVPVLPEILTQPGRSEMGGLMVQRTLRSFSFSGFAGIAYAEVLAEERTQANPSSFQDLD